MSLETLKVQIIKKAWSDPAFKESLLTNPKEVLQSEFNISVPANIELKVVEETSQLLYLIIPPSPEEIGEGASGPNIAWN